MVDKKNWGLINIGITVTKRERLQLFKMKKKLQFIQSLQKF